MSGWHAESLGGFRYGLWVRFSVAERATRFDFGGNAVSGTESLGGFRYGLWGRFPVAERATRFDFGGNAVSGTESLGGFRYGLWVRFPVAERATRFDFGGNAVCGTESLGGFRYGRWVRFPVAERAKRFDLGGNVVSGARKPWRLPLRAVLNPTVVDVPTGGLIDPFLKCLGGLESGLLSQPRGVAGPGACSGFSGFVDAQDVWPAAKPGNTTVDRCDGPDQRRRAADDPHVLFAQ